MMKKTLSLILMMILSINIAWGQANNQSSMAEESIRDISTVAAIGAVGAVLGLSTLSFVEEPKDHLKNVLIGGSIGIIIGVGVVAFKQATLSKQQYEEQAQNTQHFDTNERFVWHSKKHGKLNNDIGQKFSHVQYNFSF